MDSPPKLGQVEGEATPTLRSKAKYTGKVRLCTARYSYNPYDGPNEHPEAELPLVAGKYLYVYGTMDDDGFYEGELLDGQRGLVPSNFVDFVQDKETASSADGDTDQGYPNHAEGGLQGTEGGQQQDGRADGAPGDTAGGACANGTGAASDAGAAEEEDEDGVAGGGADAVPHPRKITLIKQLAKSVIVAWDPPLVPPGRGPVTGYNVLVDKEVRASVPAGSRTKALIEKLNLAACTYRVSVQSVAERGVSDELRCSLLVGRNVVVAPYCLRVDDITQDSALVSWLPSNSNYSHAVLLNGAEHREVRPTCYRCRLADLRPMTVYKVTAVAKPHQMPWQLPLEQREKKEMSLEFCTQAAGPPLPPQDVEVQCGHAPGILQVCWSPPALSETGTSNGASVIGYAVCTKGQRVAEVLLPLADFVTVELTRIQCLEAREVVVRTLSVQGESQDSPVAPIPSDLLVPPHPHTLPHPQHHPHTLPHPQSHPHTLPHPQPYSHPQPHPHALPQPHPHTLPHPQPHPQPHPHTLPYPPPHPQPYPHALPHPQPHLQPRPPHPITKSPPPQQPRPPAGAGEPETKEAEPGVRMGQSWDPTRSPPSAPPPQHGHSLEAPRPPGRRSPSPQRILPQPRGAPIPDTLAKAIARQAAQRVAAESGRERSGFREGNGAGHALHSDEEEEEEEGYDSAHVRRRGASVDEFLRGSELGRQIQYSQSEEYHTESSRGSDLSDIMEEDEEELYSEMQLEEGRRRSMGPHGALKVLGNAHGTGRQVRHGRDSGRGPPQRRPITVPSIDSGREHPSNRYFDESEPEDLCRVFVALFDYDPLSMSPNPDAADEELPFKEGQIIRVYGDKDTDGFYRGEIGSRAGLIPCNMVSEIQAEDEETLDQLLKQGFLSLNTPVDKIDRSRRGTRQPPTATRRMVALYDYDPRESSPNVDVEAELTFCAGDIIAVFGEIDEDGFYYGEINGHRGLIPSNFLEEVPADVEVYLTDTPRQSQDTPSGSETKRSTEILGTPRRATSPTACPPQPEAGPGAPGPELAQGPKVSLEPSLPLGTCSPLRAPDSPIRASRDLSSKKKKGLLSKGKNLLKKLAVVK
ncbi:RIMS-binding protein 2-like isoform X2 [Anguilla anguilla]|uniref:RIMS-binding protein 2-like isoform X2 n=1 Tax=Anguilla anguilla TaxID=7936 RepID=UPI0015A87C52|nr:RIMS-binding protein 2-like isoform X2 [Anguilla anguilla]